MQDTLRWLLTFAVNAYIFPVQTCSLIISHIVVNSPKFGSVGLKK